MVDRCATCRRRLTWDRPAIDVCLCGAYIRSVDAESPEVDGAVFSRRISTTLLDETSVPGIESDEALPRWWCQLSLDGSARLLTALGAIERPLETIKLAQLYQASTTTWHGIVERGLGRLRQLSRYREGEFTQLAAVVWEGCLESIALDHVSDADRQVAQVLAESIFGRSLAGRFGSLRGQLSQRRLF